MDFVQSYTRVGQKWPVADQYFELWWVHYGTTFWWIDKQLRSVFLTQFQGILYLNVKVVRTTFKCIVCIVRLIDFRLKCEPLHEQVCDWLVELTLTYINNGRSLMNSSKPEVTLNRLHMRQKKRAPDLQQEIAMHG